MKSYNLLQCVDSNSPLQNNATDQLLQNTKDRYITIYMLYNKLFQYKEVKSLLKYIAKKQ